MAKLRTFVSPGVREQSRAEKRSQGSLARSSLAEQAMQISFQEHSLEGRIPLKGLVLFRSTRDA
jgi:hypothetical protein